MWTTKAANNWYKKYPFLSGFNYLPQNCVNWTEFWQDYGFDEKIIKMELQKGKEVGYNFIRTNLQYLLWKESREEFYINLNKFIAICKEEGYFLMLSLMDDCAFSGDEPYLGQQEAAIPGIHNSQAAASPGRATVIDQKSWPNIKEYIQDVLNTYRDNETIIIWDLYNEPGNDGIFKTGRKDIMKNWDKRLKEYSHTLMINSFIWARECNVKQPLTVAAWMLDDRNPPHRPYHDPICNSALALSDIISFHAYVDKDRVVEIINYLKMFKRPIMCTEWMARANNSFIKDQIPIFKEHNIANHQWGLFDGNSQTIYPWNDFRYRLTKEQENNMWFHNIFHRDGKPYDPKEIVVLKKYLVKGGQ